MSNSLVLSLFSLTILFSLQFTSSIELLAIDENPQRDPLSLVDLIVSSFPQSHSLCIILPDSVESQWLPLIENAVQEMQNIQLFALTRWAMNDVNLVQSNHMTDRSFLTESNVIIFTENIEIEWVWARTKRVRVWNGKNEHSNESHLFWFYVIFFAFDRKLFSSVGRRQFQLNARAEYMAILLNDDTQNSFFPFNLVVDLSTEFLKMDILDMNIAIYAANQQIEIYTYYPYQEDACDQINLKQINRFFMANKSMEFERDLFEPKLKDLQQCPLVLAAFMDQIPQFYFYLYIKETAEEAELAGLEGRLLRLICDRMNTRVTLMEPTDGEYWGEIDENGSATGIIGMMRNRTADFAIGLFLQASEYYEYYDFSTSYFQTWFCFTTPPGRDFTAVQRFVAPLQLTVWMGILMSCIFMLFLSALLHLLSLREEMKTKVRSFTLNELARIFLGMNIMQMPTHSVIKIVFIGTMFGSLIVRSIYQSSLLKFLTTSRRFQPIETMDDIVSANLHLYLMEQMRFFSHSLPVDESKWVIVVDVDCCWRKNSILSLISE